MVDSPFVFVGARGVKSIIDDTLPAGAAAITYQVTAVRSKTRGQPGRFTMLLGVAPPPQ